MRRPITESGVENGWPRIAFGDVVRLSRERSNDPERDGFQRYVGLEHMEPGELTLRRWGDLLEGTTFTNVFRAGHVLFGKRRAYQRKVAVAHFDGVCSGDIYVLEPKNDQLLSELLPFICQTDGFFEHAVGTSAGSLSPRTNWESLASYEFALPPLDEQQRISAGLHAALGVYGEYAKALEQWLRLEGSVVDVLLEECRAYPQERLSNLCTRIGVGIASSATHAYRQSGVPMIRNTNISPSGIDTSELLFLDPQFDEVNKSKRVKSGDIVVARTGIPGAAAVVPASLEGAQTFTTLVISPRADRLLPGYLCSWINETPGRSFIAAYKGGGVQQNMNAGLLRELPVCVPPLARQRDVVRRLEGNAVARAQLQKRVTEARTLLSGMPEYLLGRSR